MTSILSDWGKKIVEKLISRAIAESRFVFCFTCISKEFEEERARLEVESKTLEQRAKVAIDRNKDILVKVGSWEEEVHKLIQEDTKTTQTCFLRFCPNCIWRYKRGKELAKYTGDIKRLIEKGEKLENIELPSCLRDVERYSSQDYIYFESRESKYKELLDALKDDSNYIIGLQGMGGMGKTTLAKEVGKELKILKFFSHVIDTTVSFTPDIKKIQDDIAGPLRLKWEDCNESDRPKTLWKRLTNGEKILLIMDDVWEQDPLLDFDAIGIPKRDNHNGCRVLVTTRSKQISNQMNFDKSIELDLLSEEDAWIMFKRYAGISNNCSKNVIGKGRKIAKECKQLPVAIAVIARGLKGQQHRVHEWDVTLKSLKKPVSIHGVDDDKVGFFKCLKFSYDYMKDEKAKRLFLLCSIFPEDDEISNEVLIRLCIGAGSFGEDYDIYNDARDQVVVAKNKLIDSCLLLEVDKNHVKMHDLVRDVAQWIGEKEIQRVNLSNKNQKSLVEKETNIRCLYCEGKNVDLLSCKFGCSKLETLIVSVDRDEEPGCMEVPNSFFENITNLRVLYFLGNEERSLSLPNSIQSLTNIRSMLVHMVDLGDISVLGNLQSLETLDLVQCTINELPGEITKLKKLKLLNLDYCGIRMNNPFEVIEKCSSLEELNFINSFNDFCREITLPDQLQRYHILKGGDLFDDSVSKYVVFFGNDDKEYFSKGTLKYFMETAEVIRLSKINSRWRNLMPEIVPIDDQGMNDVIDLRLERDSELQCLIDTKLNDSQVPNVFSKLVLLRLKNMENLEELCNGLISFDSMINLEELSIKYCEKLRNLFKCSINLCHLKTLILRSCSTLISLFDLSTSRSLVLLERLEIIECYHLENILVDGDNDNNKSCNSPMFPKLKFVNIERCLRLQFILPLLSTEDLLLLETIKIENCHELKYIFGQHQDVKLASLKELKLGDLPNFIDIFPESSNSIEGSSHSISKPQTHLEVEVEPIKQNNVLSWSHMCCYRYKLKGTTSTKIPLVSEDDQPQDCSISMVPNLNCLHIWKIAQCFSRLSHIMCNIKVIELVNVSKIKSVFVLSIAPKMLLERLVIKSCDKLEHIIVDIKDGSDRNELGNVFPKLKELKVYNCKKLEYIFGIHINASDDHQHHQNHIINEVVHLHLPALECLDLRMLPSLIGMCTKNYHTTLPPLMDIVLFQCSKVDIKSIGDFIVPNSMISISQEITKTIKESSGKMEHFLALKRLMLNNNPKVESIFCLNEVNEQQMNLGLEQVLLYDLPMMTCLYECPKNNFALKNLTCLKVVRCEKLETVFSTSIIRCLPHFYYLRIEQCNELKHIFEDDMENQEKSNFVSSKTTNFPKLEIIVVVKCNKLKCVIPVSICNELPELRILMIKESNELQEVIGTQGDQKVEFPNLEFVVLVDLPNLFHAQGVHFQGVPNCFVQNCQNVSLTSTLSIDISIIMFLHNFGSADYEVRSDLRSLFQQLQEESDESVEDLAAEIEVQEKSGGDMLTSSQELLNEQTTSQQYLMNQQHLLQEIDTSTKPSQGMEIISVEDFDLGDSQETTQTNNQVSLNDDTFMKVSSNIEEQFPKDGEITVFKSKPSPSSITSQFPSMLSKGFDLYLHMESIYQQFQQESKGHNNGNEDPSAQTTKEFTAWIEAEAASRHKSTFSQIKLTQTPETKHEFVENVPALEISPEAILLTNSERLMSDQSIDEQCSMNQQQSDAEIDTNVKHSQQINLKVSTSAAATTLSTISGTEDELPIKSVSPKKKVVEINVKEETASTKAKIISSSTHLELVDSSSGPLVTSTSQEDGDGKIATTSFSVATTKTDDQASLSGDVAIKVSSIVEQRSPKEDEIIVSESRSASIVSQCPNSKPPEGDPSQIVEDLSSSFIVARELEQLVFKKHLDDENLSLLTDFLVKHHSVLLRDTSLSNRYKGYAYNCLSELLKFLETHSVLDVLGSSKSEFVELLQDVRKCGFDKDWLDGVEKRALFPGLQVSEDALQKLLDSKHMLTQHVEDLKHQLASSEAVLESIIQQETLILETRAALSDPIGY